MLHFGYEDIVNEIRSVLKDICEYKDELLPEIKPEELRRMAAAYLELWKAKEILADARLELSMLVERVQARDRAKTLEERLNEL